MGRFLRFCAAKRERLGTERGGFMAGPKEVRPRAEGALEKGEIQLKGMTCPACVTRLERKLRSLPGVTEAAVHWATKRAAVTYDSRRVSMAEILKTVHEAGYGGEEIVAHEVVHREEERRRALVRHGALCLLCVFLSFPLFLSQTWHLLPAAWGRFFPDPRWQFLLATPVQVLGGFPFYRDAWRAFLKRRANLAALVAVSTTAAYVLSAYHLFVTPGPLYFETAAVVITLGLLGKLPEKAAQGGIAAAVKALAALRPVKARLLFNQVEMEVPAEEVQPGDLVVVRPGERIPVDGVVVAGEATVAEGTLTGEKIPVEKSPGDRVFCGTVNKFGTLRCRATGVGRETVLGHVISLLEEAQGMKRPVLPPAEEAAARFFPVAVAAAVLTFLGWYWLGEPGEAAPAWQAAAAVLVIACPAALSLAAPASLLAAQALGARQGLHIRSGEHLLAAHRLDTAILDPADLITRGTPEVTAVFPLGGLGEEEVLQLAASVEKLSEHPLAGAVVQKARERGLPLVAPKSFHALPGFGVQCTLPQGQVLIGDEKLMGKMGIDLAPGAQVLARLQQEGQRAMLVALEGKLAGIIALAETVPETVREAVTGLQALGLTVYQFARPHLAPAPPTAGVLAAVWPEEKAAAVRQLQAAGRVVAVIGNGINDAPALAAADTGIATGRGMKVAQAAAGIILRDGELRGAVAAVALSRAAVRNMRENTGWAFLYHALGMPLAALGLLSPEACSWAVFLGVVSVLVNARRLLNFDPYRLFSKPPLPSPGADGAPVPAQGLRNP